MKIGCFIFGKLGFVRYGVLRCLIFGLSLFLGRFGVGLCGSVGGSFFIRGFGVMLRFWKGFGMFRVGWVCKMFLVDVGDLLLCISCYGVFDGVE